MSPALNIEVEHNGNPSLVDLNEEMHHMDVEESQCEFNHRAVVPGSKGVVIVMHPVGKDFLVANNL